MSDDLFGYLVLTAFIAGVGLLVWFFRLRNSGLDVNKPLGLSGWHFRKIVGSLGLLLALVAGSIFIGRIDKRAFERMNSAQHLAAAKTAENNFDWAGALQHLDAIKPELSRTQEVLSLYDKARTGLAAQQEEERKEQLARAQAREQARANAANGPNDVDSLSFIDHKKIMVVTDAGNWLGGEYRHCDIKVSKNPDTLACHGDYSHKELDFRIDVVFHDSMTVANWDCKRTSSEVECWKEGTL